MQRRQFVYLTAAAMGLTPSAFGSITQVKSSHLAQPYLLTLLGDADAVHAVGVAYRAAHPHENNAVALIARLRPVAATLDAQVQADFAAGRTVCLDGWILARTEARQCALFSLLQDGGSHAY